MSVAEADESLRESQALAGMLPGPVLASELAEIPLGVLDEYALVEVMRAARRLTAWAESVELGAIAELDRRRTAQADRYGAWTVEMSRAEVDEISAALTLSGTAAAIRSGMASALHSTLPGTRQALAEGRIDATKARVICDGVIGITAELARKVEALVLPDAARLTARQLAARVRKAIFEADPEAFEERRKTAEKGRRLEQYDNPDGTSDLAVRDLPADVADAAYNYVNALAAALKCDGDPRPIDAIRADVTVELMRGRHPAQLSATPADPGNAAPAPDYAADATEPGDTADPPTGGDTAAPDAPSGPRRDGRPTTTRPANTRATPSTTPSDNVSATSSATAAGDRDTGRHEAAEITRTVREQLTELLDQVCELNRPVQHRLLIAEAAHHIADALAPLKIRWCRITVAPDGDVAHGHDGYRPPAGMRRLIQARNGTCTFPTCRRRATSCDLDHTVPYNKGGPTCPCKHTPRKLYLAEETPHAARHPRPYGHHQPVGPKHHRSRPPRPRRRTRRDRPGRDRLRVRRAHVGH